jgi:hypothetical protein
MVSFSDQRCARPSALHRTVTQSTYVMTPSWCVDPAMWQKYGISLSTGRECMQLWPWDVVNGKNDAPLSLCVNGWGYMYVPFSVALLCATASACECTDLVFSFSDTLGKMVLCECKEIKSVVSWPVSYSEPLQHPILSCMRTSVPSIPDMDVSSAIDHHISTRSPVPRLCCTGLMISLIPSYSPWR